METTSRSSTLSQVNSEPRSSPENQSLTRSKTPFRTAHHKKGLLGQVK